MRSGGVLVKKYLISSRQLVATGPSLVSVLRFAIGISAAYQGPLVTVALSGEAVRCALRNSQQSLTDVYLKSAMARDVKVWIESESLEALNLTKEDPNWSIAVPSVDRLVRLALIGCPPIALKDGSNDAGHAVLNVL